MTTAGASAARGAKRHRTARSQLYTIDGAGELRRWCGTCEAHRTLGDFHPSSIRGSDYHCRSCVSTKGKANYKKRGAATAGGESLSAAEEREIIARWGNVCLITGVPGDARRPLALLRVPSSDAQLPAWTLWAPATRPIARACNHLLPPTYVDLWRRRVDAITAACDPVRQDTPTAFSVEAAAALA